MLIDLIRREIEKGLPNEQSRFTEAKTNRAFFEEEWAAYESEWRQGQPEDTVSGPIVTIPFMRRVIELLTIHLYKFAPRRSTGDAEADKWLSDIYTQENVNRRWKQADALALVGDFCAFRVIGRTDEEGTPDPDRPIQIDLWYSDSLTVWADPDEPTRPIALATADRHDQQTRYKLYTADLIETYLTAKGDQTAGGRTSNLVEIEDNPYGIIPFALVHAFPPVDTLTRPGIGVPTRKFNDNLNMLINGTYEDVSSVGRPRGVKRGTEERWSPPKPWKPHQFVTIPGQPTYPGGPPAQAALEFLQAPLEFVGVNQDYCEWLMSVQYQFRGIPDSVIRAVAESAASGASIMAEQAPLIAWAEGRQDDFSSYERDLADVTYRVGEVHGLVTRPKEPLSVHYRKIDTANPEERDRADAWDLERGLVSRVGLMMRRNPDMTREQAIEACKAVDEEEEMFPSRAKPPGGNNPFEEEESNADDSEGEESQGPEDSEEE